MTNNTILEAVDPEVMDTLTTRAGEIRQGRSTSSFVAAGLAMGSIPLAMAALAKDAYAAAPTTVAGVLRFAYLLENLEAEFYKTVLATGANFSATNNPQAAAFAPLRAAIAARSDATAILNTLNVIRVHEEQHVAYLKTALGSSAPTFTGADFDFTGGVGTTPGAGPFAPATSDVQIAMAATQGFEDTGVRAYKGQAGTLFTADTAAGKPTLTAALQIHSVEARHAARIRRIRRALNPSVTVLRYSGTVRGGGLAAAGVTADIAGAFAKIYGGATPESNTTQGYNDGSAKTVNIANITFTGVSDSANAITEAFDEPLTFDEVVAIVSGFIRDTKGLLA